MHPEVETPRENKPVYWLSVLIGTIAISLLLGALMLAGGVGPG